MGTGRSAKEHLQDVKGAQIKAGRALIGMRQTELAALASLSCQYVIDLERRECLPERAGRMVVNALSAKGVEFIRGGVRRVV